MFYTTKAFLSYKDIDIEFLSNFSSFSAFTSLKIHTKHLAEIKDTEARYKAKAVD